MLVPSFQQNYFYRFFFLYDTLNQITTMFQTRENATKKKMCYVFHTPLS